MARLVQFAILLTPNDRRRRRHIVEKGKILQFVVQYETKVKNHWHPVVRYDTAHGYAHKHLFHAEGSQKISRMQIMDYNSAMTVAEDDIRQNWPNYKAAYLKEVE